MKMSKHAITEPSAIFLSVSLGVEGLKKLWSFPYLEDPPCLWKTQHFFETFPKESIQKLFNPLYIVMPSQHQLKADFHFSVTV